MGSVSKVNSHQGSYKNNMPPTSNLTVGHPHLTPRKSIIGRLERSSFQTQRLSDVGIAFGQQITAKMGLKLPASQERVVEQTRWLYLRYVFVKLHQNSLPVRDLNLTKTSRARRAVAMGELPIVSVSAPATASADQHATPLLTSMSRKRTIIAGNLDYDKLTLLAGRSDATNLGPSHMMRSSDDIDRRISQLESSRVPLKSGFQVDRVASKEQSTGGSSSANKKYIMDPTINNQIFAVIVKVIRELRELKPDFYGDTIYELIGIDKFSSIQSLMDVQMTLCQEMTRSEISWCRIIALFALFGAISLDCVRLGTPEHVGPILDGFIEFVERDLALWISQQGGWEAFLYKHRAGRNFWHLTSRAPMILIPVFAICIYMWFT